VGLTRPIAAAILALVILVSLGACGSDNAGSKTDAVIPRARPGPISPDDALGLARQIGAVPDEITYVNGSPPDPNFTDHPPVLERAGDAFASGDSGTSLGVLPGSGLSFRLPDRTKIRALPTAVGPDASAALEIAKRTGIFYPNIYPSTDSVITVDQGGLTETLIFRGRGAPRRLTWSVSASDPGLRLTQNGYSVGLVQQQSRNGSSYPFYVTLFQYRGKVITTADVRGARPVPTLKLTQGRMELSLPSHGTKPRFPFTVQMLWHRNT
jgi:hypothetical protein